MNRKRSVNYSGDEVEVLTTEVSRRNKVLFSKLQGPITAASKEKGWAEVAKAVSAVGSSVRTIADVKKKWSCMKSSTKARLSGLRRDQAATGGGAPDLPAMSAAEDRILQVMGDVCVSGISGGVDSADFIESGWTILTILTNYSACVMCIILIFII
jgi:hypothetical protein